MRRLALAVLGLVFIVGPRVWAQPSPIAFGVVTPRTGPFAALGEAIVIGAEMRVEEANQQGLLGRKLDLVIADAQSRPDDAARAAAELVSKKIELVIGGLTSAQALAVASVSAREKFVYIETVAKADELTSRDRIHRFVFRTAGTVSGEARAAAIFAARQKVGNRLASIATDAAYFKNAPDAFTSEFRRLEPRAEIVEKRFVSQEERDFTSSVTALRAAKPDVLFVALLADQFAAFVRDAKSLFEAIGNRVVAVNYVGAPSVVVRLGANFPFGIWADTPDQPDWDNGCTGSECSETREPHSGYARRLREYLKRNAPAKRDADVPLAIQGYIGVDILLAAVKAAGAANADAVASVLPGLKLTSALGPLMIGAKDHELNRGEFFGRVVEDRARAYAGVEKGALYVRP
jgi:branched-chain amino acid transport system substrate-binding protein